MPRSVAVFAVAGSPLGGRLASALSDRECEARLLSLDAPLQGLPVTVGPGRLIWEGLDLLATGAVFVELPLYSWPQPHQIEGAPSGAEARTAFFAADREARSMALSAICIAAETVPVVNDPHLSYYASAPATALAELEAAGLPVRPWSLEEAPSEDALGGRPVLDAAGREHWHRPSRPPQGDLSLRLAPDRGAVTSLLVIGGEIAGTMRYVSAAAWAAGAGEPAPRPGKGAAHDLAQRAAASLKLEVVATTIAESATATEILFCEAGPDLVGWDDALGGSVVRTLAGRMAALARRGLGERR